MATALVLVIGCLTASTALAGGGNGAATVTYLRAARQALKEISALLPQAGNAMAEFVLRTTKTCPSVADHPPAGEQLNMFREDLLDAVIVAGQPPLQKAATEFAEHILNLHWTNRTLTRLVQDHARELLTVTEPPPLCAQLTEWVVSGYRTLPTGTRTSLEDVAASATTEEALMSSLVHSTPIDARTLLRTVRHLEQSDASVTIQLGSIASRRLEEGLGL